MRLVLVLCWLAALIPARGLAVCIGEDGHVALGAVESEDPCPCDEDPDHEPGRDTDEHDPDCSDLEFPSLATAREVERGSTAQAIAPLLGAAPRADALAPVAIEPASRRAAPPRWPPGPSQPLRCQRTVRLRI